ncbi:hypothetical protein D9M70_488050 [compost metagenome]
MGRSKHRRAAFGRHLRRTSPLVVDFLDQHPARPCGPGDHQQSVEETACYNQGAPDRWSRRHIARRRDRASAAGAELGRQPLCMAFAGDRRFARLFGASLGCVRLAPSARDRASDFARSAQQSDRALWNPGDVSGAGRQCRPFSLPPGLRAIVPWPLRRWLGADHARPVAWHRVRSNDQRADDTAPRPLQANGTRRQHPQLPLPGGARRSRRANNPIGAGAIDLGRGLRLRHDVSGRDHFRAKRRRPGASRRGNRRPDLPAIARRRPWCRDPRRDRARQWPTAGW